MSNLKKYTDTNVLTAARERVAYAFDNFAKVSVSFSGGKDSTVMLHLVMDEAIRRGRRVTVFIVDMEAQYRATIDHLQACVDLYRFEIVIEWFWVSVSLRL